MVETGKTKHLFGAFQKAKKEDDGTLVVSGILSDGNTRDSDGELITADCMAKAMGPWMEEWGNVREQHDPHIAAGKGISYECADDGKTYFEAKIVEPTTVKKIEEGVLKGFSVRGVVPPGGRNATDKTIIEELNITEASVVDRPSCPTCLIEVFKAHGAAPDPAPAPTDDAEKVARRKDVSPKAGEEKYGKVPFADAKNKKYPLDTEDHIRAAWNYVHQKRNAAKYSAEDVKTIKARIVAAWKKKIDKDGPPSAAEKAAGASAGAAEGEAMPDVTAPANLDAAMLEAFNTFFKAGGEPLVSFVGAHRSEIAKAFGVIRAAEIEKAAAAVEKGLSTQEVWDARSALDALMSVLYLIQGEQNEEEGGEEEQIAELKTAASALQAFIAAEIMEGGDEIAKSAGQVARVKAAVKARLDAISKAGATFSAKTKEKMQAHHDALAKCQKAMGAVHDQMGEVSKAFGEMGWKDGKGKGAEKDDDAGEVEAAANAGEVEKALGAARAEKDEVAKSLAAANARVDELQKALGAAEAKTTAATTKADELEKSVGAMRVERDEAVKAYDVAADALGKVIAERDETVKSLAKLTADLSAKGILRAVPVEKAQDSGAPGGIADAGDDATAKDEIKKAHRAGRPAFTL